jgi:acetolactate decarboxylase
MGPVVLTVKGKKRGTMKRALNIMYLVGVAVFINSCAAPQRNTVTQISTIDAILAGVYDGQMTCKELLSYGDFGIGTFHRLDGEMILLDGRIYQVRHDGTVHSPPLNLTSPFASVAAFVPDVATEVDYKFDYPGLEKIVNDAVPNMNLFCAVKVTGRFPSMETRSVPPQQKPYPPLAEVTENQQLFFLQNVSGTIVGFRSPPYVKGINVPGYHLHFMSENGESGGHVLHFVAEKGSVEIDICNRFLMILPEGDSGFAAVNLSRDRSEDLEKSER